MSSLPAVTSLPAHLKSIGHLLKVADEHQNRDAVVTYWCRLAALQNALKIDKSSKEALGVLLPIMEWLEKEKKVLSDNEAVSNDVVANAHLENHAFKLFNWADGKDRQALFDKNVVKAFYTASVILDAIQASFGSELTEENERMRTYSKWKAADIHACLKEGRQPRPGPSQEDNLEEQQEQYLEPQIPEQQDQLEEPEVEDVSRPEEPEEEESERSVGLDPMQLTQVKKYCKYASSALDYNDTDTAIDNLEKALQMLKATNKN